MDYGPYPDDAANQLYALLFCDQPELFVNLGKVWPALFAPAPDEAALRAIADNADVEARVRALAYGRLRQLGKSVPAKLLLGAVIEVPLDAGLDVLAVYAEGGVRYINASGKISIFEGDAHPVINEGRALLAASQIVVNQIGPWHKPRLAPPKSGNVRMSFIVSDGLYFGEGVFETLERDALGGPVLQAATKLLVAVVNLNAPR